MYSPITKADQFVDSKVEFKCSFPENPVFSNLVNFIKKVPNINYS